MNKDMDLSKIFGKIFGGGSTAQDEVDTLISENIKEGETPPTPAGEGATVSKDVEIQKITMDLDRIKAKVEAFTQMRQALTERIERINETTGDLRRMIIDNQESINKLKLDATKAIEMVAAVQPDKLMIETKKLDAKVEKLNATQDADHRIRDNIVEEMKNLRNTISVFRGAESLIKLNEDIKKELMSVTKVEATVKAHSDKVESIFINVQKQFNQFLELSGRFDDLHKSFEASQKTLAQLTKKVESSVTKDDLGKFEKTIDERIQPADILKEDLRAKNEEFAKMIDEGNKVLSAAKTLVEDVGLQLDECKKKIEKIRDDSDKAYEKLDSAIKKIDAQMSKTDADRDKKFETLVDNIQAKFNNLESRFRKELADAVAKETEEYYNVKSDLNIRVNDLETKINDIGSKVEGVDMLEKGAFITEKRLNEELNKTFKEMFEKIETHEGHIESILKRIGMVRRVGRPRKVGRPKK